MKKQQWIYSADTSNRYRYVLGVKGKRMLAIIGANPSTAIPGAPDRTVKKIHNIAASKGFDGWILLNLWPERETHPSKLRKRILTPVHQNNIAAIENTLSKYQIEIIWAAWGNIITLRPFLGRCYNDIIKIKEIRNKPWIQLSPPTLKGHPRHPLYSPAKPEFTNFIPDQYASGLC